MIHEASNRFDEESDALRCPDCASVRVLPTETMVETSETLPPDVEDLCAAHDYYCMECYAVFG